MNQRTGTVMTRKGARAASSVALVLLICIVVATFSWHSASPRQDHHDNQVLAVSYQHRDLQASTADAIQQVLYDIDNEALERYKASPSGFRYHPAYYSDKYLRRAPKQSFDERLALEKKWGAWTLVDQKRSIRPGDDFYSKYPNRDVPWSDFPDTAWQRDAEYLPKFLDEGIALVERAMEAILTEYGFGNDRDNRDFSERIKILGVSEQVGKGRPGTGASVLGDSYKGLVRRILHAIVTEDSFTLAMSGHSAAAGHGNHFQQSYTHAYGTIMEPIFARLGVLSVSRNFGFGGLGTIQTGMATSDLMGADVDLLLWDSGMTEKGPAIGILGAQGMLGGNRVPFFLVDVHGLSFINDLNKGADADVGVSGSGDSFIYTVNSPEELEARPWASGFMNCGRDIQSTLCKGNHYRGKCWLERSNFVWGGMNMSFTPNTQQNPEPGGRASWHPGDRVHQKLGRALTGFVLHGLRDALLSWKNSTNLELQDEEWHVTEYYDNIRTKLRTDFGKDLTLWCVQALIPEIFCQKKIQARTEFTPRYDPARTNLRTLLKSNKSPIQSRPAIYDPPDVFNPNLHAPEGALDVLAIVENGVDFVPTLGHVRRRVSLPPANSSPSGVGSPVNPDIVPGKGWYLQGPGGTDMCNGERDSWCNRQEGIPCLLYAHNDFRGSLVFDSLSGWAIFELPNVREGLIVIKYHDWLSAQANPLTQDWCNINNDPPCPSEERALAESPERHLKKPPPPFCDGFRFEFAIDGKITSWDEQAFLENQVKAQRVVQLSTLLDDPNYTGVGPRNLELAIRITGCGRQKVFALTHIYWA